jgi:hypothetical protein
MSYNRGTGAGGAKTNANGLLYETATELSVSEFSQIPNFVERGGVQLKKAAFYKHMDKLGAIDKTVLPAAGCKQPDEVVVVDKQVFIIEKKFQNGPGSVDEKIQTAGFKTRHYQSMFPKYRVHYIYCLSDWFKKPEYKSVLAYLGTQSVPVFWGQDAEYKTQIMDYICQAVAEALAEAEAEALAEAEAEALAEPLAGAVEEPLTL